MTQQTAHPCPLCGNDRDRQPTVCRGCEARGERDLRDLPRLAATLLDMARRPATATFAEPVSGSREKPLPLHPGIWSFVGLAPPGDVHAPDPDDALCQIGDVPLADALHDICRNAADDLDVSVPRVRRNTAAGLAVGKFSRFLLAQHDRICALPWAGVYLTELADLWCRARTLAQDWPLVHKLPAWCPYCATLTLRRDNGASFVYCDDRYNGCGRRWTEHDYQRLVLILVTQAKETGWASTAKATT